MIELDTLKGLRLKEQLLVDCKDIAAWFLKTLQQTTKSIL